MERNQYIASKRDGFLKRFYPLDVGIPEGKFYPNPLQESIMKVIEKRPGISQSALGRELNMKRQLVGYHLRILKRVGQIRTKRKGKISRVYLKKGKGRGKG